MKAIKPESIFAVRGYDVNGDQQGETQRRQTSGEAAFAAKEMLDGGCRCIDIDVLTTGPSCQSD